MNTDPRSPSQITDEPWVYARTPEAERTHVELETLWVKTALALVRRFDVIACEDLRVANMTRRPKPRPQDDGRGSPGGDSPREAASAAESQNLDLDPGGAS